MRRERQNQDGFKLKTTEMQVHFITLDEFIQLMSKYGIMKDPQTAKSKVKLYKDNQGNLEGDGLCCYLKKESVDLTLKLLDEDEIRGYELHVEVAKFLLKREYDGSKKKF
ncbi:hypothetical protein QTO34_016805 [Cnephaeus nilssonii]|uniref:Uncharacterized protein n=1 Tax=Cnephaeus nilssonii TaxID=3371016 RepID=A0AA40I2X7_CNENI|nr:hypothetical protein QTO34_016805 [Eptesicus nilssonii]